MHIKKANLSDLPILLPLAFLLFGGDKNTLEQELKKLLCSKNHIFFLLYVENKEIAFASASLRFDYVEGSKTSPVGYLEAIFVKEEFRRKSYASSLLKAYQLWALEQGALEFASDCESKNLDSIKFHQVMGFDITNHLVCFIKKLKI